MWSNCVTIMKYLQSYLTSLTSAELNTHNFPYVLEVKVPNACTYRFGFNSLSIAEETAQTFLHISLLKVSILNVIDNESTIYKLN